MNLYRNWFLASRPWSFSMTAISVSVGSALGAIDGSFSWAFYLALAREIVVTADSIAMLSEACATGKPVYLFDPNRRRESHDFRMGGSAYRLLMRIGPQRLTRDVGRVHARLVAAGHAAWLGESAAGGASAPPDDMARALARVRQLLEVNH